MIDLKALAEQIAAQNNRITADPIFVVFQKREIVTDEDHDHDFMTWLDDEGNGADDKTKARLDRVYNDPKSDWSYSDEIEIGETGDDEEETTTWKRIAIKEVDEFVTACFTEQACKDYIFANSYNLHKPFIFAASLYRNHEMIGLREYILSHREQAV